MQGVNSYHFRLDNSVDTNTVESIQASKNNGVPEKFLRETLFQGDVQPPVARFSNSKDSTFSQMVVMGKDMYIFNEPGAYHKLGGSGSSWYYWINTGGLNNPEEFINYTLDTTLCATIVGEEQVDGVTAIHVRYNLITDDLSVRSTHRRYLYVRDFWVEKTTHYIRRLQTHEIYTNGKPCEQSFDVSDHDVSYITGILTYSKHNVPVSPPMK